MRLKRGQRLGGKYELHRLLGKGGQAEIWEARPLEIADLSRNVVLKLFESDGKASARTMFEDEARLAAMIRHPNVVKLYDMGEEEGLFYIAMEYISGQDLSVLLERCKEVFSCPLPWPVAVRIIADLCKGLGYAHKLTDKNGQPLDLVHRDLKPSNVLVTAKGEVKLIDFGIAKATISQHKTVTGNLKGTPYYISPEQIADHRPTQRSDLYAIGVLLYELCSGEKPFYGNDLLSLLFKVSTVAPEPLRETLGLPEALTSIIYRLMAKEPEERHHSAEHIQQELESVLRTRNIDLDQDELGRFLRALSSNQKDVYFPWWERHSQTTDPSGFSLRTEPAGVSLSEVNRAVSTKEATLRTATVEPLSSREPTDPMSAPPPESTQATALMLAIEPEDENSPFLTHNTTDDLDFDAATLLPSASAELFRYNKQEELDELQNTDTSFPRPNIGRSSGESSRPRILIPPATRREPPGVQRPPRKQTGLLKQSQPPKQSKLPLVLLLLLFVSGASGTIAYFIQRKLEEADKKANRAVVLPKQALGLSLKKGRTNPPSNPVDLSPKPRKAPAPKARKRPKRRRHTRAYGWVRFRITPDCLLFQGTNPLGQANSLVLRKRPGVYRLRCINRSRRLLRTLRVRVRAGRKTLLRRSYASGSLFLLSFPWSDIYLPSFGKIGRSQEKIKLPRGSYRLVLYKRGKSAERKTIKIKIRAGKLSRPVVRW